MKISFSPVILLVTLLIGLSPAFAADDKAPSRVAPPPIPVKVPKLNELQAWLALPEERRAAIVTEWMALPETTRPSFPAYRARLLSKPEGDQLPVVDPDAEPAAEAIAVPVIAE